MHPGAHWLLGSFRYQRHRAGRGCRIVKLDLNSGRESALYRRSGASPIYPTIWPDRLAYVVRGRSGRDLHLEQRVHRDGRTSTTVLGRAPAERTESSNAGPTRLDLYGKSIPDGVANWIRVARASGGQGDISLRRRSLRTGKHHAGHSVQRLAVSGRRRTNRLRPGQRVSDRRRAGLPPGTPRQSASARLADRRGEERLGSRALHREPSPPMIGRSPALSPGNRPIVDVYSPTSVAISDLDPPLSRCSQR